MNEKRIKLFSSLAHSKYRKEHRLFLVEGVHGVESLLDSDWDMETVIISDDFDDPSLLSKAKANLVERVGRGIIDRIVTTKTPQDIAAVVRIPKNDIETVCRHDKILVADGIKDPGNLGTMIRTAEALGFGSVITTSGSVDLYNPKVVRASQGSMFSIDIAQRINTSEVIKRLKSDHVFYALSADGDIDPMTVEIERKLALVIGAEISGVCRELTEISKYRVRIPILGKSESLNAAVAAGIAMHMFGRR